MGKKVLVSDAPMIKEEINEFSLLASGEKPKTPEKKASKPKKEEMSRFNVYQEENDVWKPVGRQPVEDIGRNCRTSQKPCEPYDHRDWHRVQQHYEEAVH